MFALSGGDYGGDYNGGSVGLYFFEVLYWEVGEERVARVLGGESRGYI